MPPPPDAADPPPEIVDPSTAEVAEPHNLVCKRLDIYKILSDFCSWIVFAN